MVTIAHIVAKIIEQRPFMQEALSRGIINNAALAEQITPQIEKELKKKVKFSAVNMAIRRLSEKLEKMFVQRINFDKNCDITIKSDLVEIISFNIPSMERILKEIHNIVDSREGDYLTLTQGLHEVMVITQKKHEKKIIALFPSKSIKKIIRNLSSLTIKVPENAYETAGLFYLTTRALAWENISLVEIVSTLTEMTYIVKEEDTTSAFSVLKETINLNS